MTERAAIELTGLVQGVGFRPFVYSLAATLNLRGFVQNRGAHVFVDVEGDASSIDAFVDRVLREQPLHSAIEKIRKTSLAPAFHERFVIADSDASADPDVFVPPDVATCDECLAELADSANRRYRHPFIACSACGPRYSTIARLPFDRQATSMAGFPMCAACAHEYRNPRDRRFHAQGICCPQCGPRLAIQDAAHVIARDDDALTLAAKKLTEGAIVAVKGIGGFHLACDATSNRAVVQLRRRKKRDSKPFALMLPWPEGQALASRLDADVRAILLSPSRPIVLMDRRALEIPPRWILSQHVAPASPTLGVFLPYSPLHHLLLTDTNRPLLLTSGNRRDEPIACDDEQAIDQLGDIADFFVTHDRPILRRCDDSVVRVFAGRSAPIRAGRGTAPVSLTLAERAAPAVLGLGADLKNTFCLTAGGRAYLSAHVGNIASPQAFEGLSAAVSQLTQLLQLEPSVIVHDRHPDFLSTRAGERYPSAERLTVQHHHAHVLSCVAEHGCTDPVIGVAFDGAGLGDDGAVWGGEFLVIDGIHSQRAAHLAYVPLPGGDAAAREPWRMAVAHLASAFGPDFDWGGEITPGRISPAKMTLVRQMVARGTCSPPTSSVGRLFDAAAALLGLCDVVDFEGQAAMALEAVATTGSSRRYALELDTSRNPWTLSAAPVMRAIAEDVQRRRSVGEISAAFHSAVADAIVRTCGLLARQSGIRRVVLTGGVFQNARLSQEAAHGLATMGLGVLAHRRVPCNDGGLSLGQALFAVRVLCARSAKAGEPICA